MFLLFFKVLNAKYNELENLLLITQIKHIFTNDPCEKLVYLRHTKLFNSAHLSVFGTAKNFAGEIKTPIKIDSLAEKSFLFLRKTVKCIKN
jgi:hypothetical protein